MQQLLFLFRSFLPQNKRERILYALLLIVYAGYSAILVFCSSFVDTPHMVPDIFSSFDTAYVYHYGIENHEGHPLMVYILKPILLIGNKLSLLLGGKAKTVFWLAIWTSLISLSVVYVYRYLRQIVELDEFRACLLTVFYSFFSTNLVLCFIIDSFTMSLFLLAFSVWFFSWSIKRNERLGFASGLFLSFALGGVTITNFAKGIIPLFFTNLPLKIKIRRTVILGLLFTAVVVLALLRVQVFERLFWRINEFTSVVVDNHGFWEKVTDTFWGIPVFFSTVGWRRERAYADFFEGGMIYTDYYHCWWQYLFSGILLLLVILAAFKNRWNKLVCMLVALFSVDVFIHIVYGYGATENFFIYGGHWVYIVPLLLGWLCKSAEGKRKQLLTILLACLLAAIVINNSIQMTHFIREAIVHFPPAG
ncbi:MAG: DUF6080 domain-containing protein [Prevotella sp.]|jgi:hypothetical protein|nr:DUF6080 domain-containing protein [Prevotella sp.]